METCEPARYFVGHLDSIVMVVLLKIYRFFQLMSSYLVLHYSCRLQTSSYAIECNKFLSET